ncbi:transcriptional regulator, AbrB family [Methanospirillum hungatei JF-1]|jgi:AbrB family looped-hinge helix DNA binding protein|uniref:Transcriptional regulator, AbrB family n=1 Tax=Methanospirillum hungatei JF-1 (strain ATCC 27890 / DSM 864 / NBRC 100397 / JF-1) TaxID=323259 RepID=Q2FME0_METHJ|nr:MULTISPECIES: AbrB/MazE/SpoVT family DNA-binding domain-containing protein [Methanospirillum]ABD41622.1 transcriptional regulator, AbrB family [Methanospirillum hungatei JF-1]MBP9007169.1 AbrB/MazE/SpoVT family DNA-binding domain-containing protein [Methanospirillum sp.]NLL09382.1 AbrB/MazE/SpoVT family DNA-binding domain-containing protein [Methanomicrobiales archaeon]
MEVGKVADNGHIFIPLPLRKKYNLNDGDTILLEERENGLLLIPCSKLSVLMGAYNEDGLLDDLEKLRKQERSLV